MPEKSMLPKFPGNLHKDEKNEKVEQLDKQGTDEIVQRLMNENAFQRTQIRAAMRELSKRVHNCDGLSLMGSVSKVLGDFETQTKKHYEAINQLKSIKKAAVSSKNAELSDEIDKILECLK